MSQCSTDGEKITSLEELADILTSWHGEERGLYVRWTDDVERDARTEVSRDELTGIELPGSSANSLAVESWWNDRPMTTWVARRLYDYRHLAEVRGPGTCPCVVSGVETGRGPDNEPLIARCEPIALIDFSVIDDAAAEVENLGDDWGSLRRG